MSIFHKHKWVEASKKFHEPIQGNIKLKGDYSVKSIDRMVHGFTSTKLVCTECGYIKIKESLGDIT